MEEKGETKRFHLETSSRVSSATTLSIIDINLRSNAGSAFPPNELTTIQLSDDVITTLNVRSINEQKRSKKKKIKKLLKSEQAKEFEENSNNLENLSVSVQSSNMTLIKTMSKKTKQVKKKMDKKSKNDDKIKHLYEEPGNEYSKQTNFSDNIVRPQSVNHARVLNHKITAESQKEKESCLVPGFGCIAIMVLLIGIILGFLGAFGGNSFVNF
jgi:hypothetical protein